MNSREIIERVSDPPTAYLTKLEAAKELRISPRTLDQWMARRLIPFVRIGRCVRFRRTDLQKIGVEVEAQR